MSVRIERTSLILTAEKQPQSGIDNLQSHQIYRNPRLSIKTDVLPPLQNNYIRVKMLYVGICGTDIHIATADPETGYVMSSAPADLDAKGRILGHEGVGKIIDIASNVTHLKVGQLVAFESIQTCGYCEPCRSSKPNQCIHAKLVGMEIDGMFGNVVDLPADLAFDVTAFNQSSGGIQAAACLEPAGIAYLACMNARIQPGESVAVFGAGPIGLLTAMLCRLVFGASNVCLIEPLSFRREYASQWTDAVLAPKDFLKDSRKFDIIIDSSGDLEMVAASLDKILAGGRVGLLARNGKPLSINKVDLLITRNISIFGARGHLGGLYEKLAQLYLSGRLPIHLIITNVIHGLNELYEYIKHPEVIIQENCKVLCQLEQC